MSFISTDLQNRLTNRGSQTATQVIDDYHRPYREAVARRHSQGGYQPPSEATPKPPIYGGQQYRFGTVNQRGDTIPVFNQGQGRTREGYPINSFGGGAQPSAQPQVHAYQPPSPQLPSYQQPTQPAQVMNPTPVLTRQNSGYSEMPDNYWKDPNYTPQAAPASASAPAAGTSGAVGQAYYGQSGIKTRNEDGSYTGYTDLMRNEDMPGYNPNKIQYTGHDAAGMPTLNRAATSAQDVVDLNAQNAASNAERMASGQQYQGVAAQPTWGQVNQSMNPGLTDLQQYVRNRGTGIVGGYQKPQSFQPTSSPLIDALYAGSTGGVIPSPGGYNSASQMGSPQVAAQLRQFNM